MKKMILSICMMGTCLCVCGACSNSAKDNPASVREVEETSENGTAASNVSIEGAYYYDMLTDDSGDIYALTDSFAEDGSGAIAWKSSDQGNTWEKMLHKPEELTDACESQAGALRIGEEGLEAYVVFSEYPDETGEESVPRLFRITEKGCDELEAAEVFEQIGNLLWNINIVNDHVIALASGEQCVLYDTDKQEVLKSLTYDPYTVGFLPMQKQFLVYGKEIVYCLNAETLEEEEAEGGLKKFVSDMFKENDSSVIPPMYTDNATVVCAAAEAVYEYRDGETEEVLSVPYTVNGENPLNGIMPMCKGKDKTYFVSVFGDEGAELKRIKPDENSDKKTLTIYTLTENQDIMKIATLFQQEHPEMNVDVQVGMEEEAALTRTDIIKQLNTELLAGEGPDIIIMDGLSVEQYAEKGLLLPLELEQPEDKYFENIIDIYQSKNTLYAVPTGFWLYAVQGPEDMGAAAESPEDMCKWVLSNADKAGLCGYEYSYRYNTYSQYAQFLYDICSNSIFSNGEVDKEALETYMTVCGRLAEVSGQAQLDEEYVTSSILPGVIEAHCNDEVEISAGIVLNGEDLAALATEQEKGDSEYGIYPLYQPRNIISVNADTEHEEAAREFAEFSLEETVQKTNLSYCLPVERKAFYSVMKGGERAADSEGLLREINLGEEEKSFVIYSPDEKEIDSLEKEIKEIDDVCTDNVILRDITMEAMEAYLSGTVTMEDAVSSACNKIELYQGE